MANELTLTGSLTFAKGSISVDLEKAGLQVTVTGTEYIRNTQICVVDPGAALALGSITTTGWFLGINRDSTNSISIKRVTGETATILIRPGEFALFRFAAAAPFVFSSAGTPVLEYLLIED